MVYISCMKSFLTRWVQKWSKKENVEDEKWLEVIQDIERSSTTVDHGGGLYKVRMASKGKGKSGGLCVFKVRG